MNLLKTVLAGGVLAATLGTAVAAPVLLQSNYVQVNITDLGVLSSLRYDPTNAGIFPSDKDYIEPGIPFEGFEVRSGISGTSVFANSNSGGASISGTTAVATGAFDYGALWSGTSSFFDISHLFYFNNGDQRVNIKTTVTAKSDLTNVRVSRAVDPDPDARSFSSFSTQNQRGIAAQSVSVNDFVGSLGSISGLPLGLFYNGAITHNTGIVDNCCSVTNADIYLAGGQLGNGSSGDNGIGIGFALGDLFSGQSVSWNYAYVMGGSLATIDILPPTGVPEPSTLLLVAGALGALVTARRRRA